MDRLHHARAKIGVRLLTTLAAAACCAATTGCRSMNGQQVPPPVNYSNGWAPNSGAQGASQMQGTPSSPYGSGQSSYGGSAWGGTSGGGSMTPPSYGQPMSSRNTNTAPLADPGVKTTSFDPNVTNTSSLPSFEPEPSSISGTPGEQPAASAPIPPLTPSHSSSSLIGSSY